MASYGRAKTRDMIRSILPSTARKGARKDKRLANRRARQRVAMACRVYGYDQHECECGQVWVDEIEDFVDVCDCDDASMDAFDTKIAEADFAYNNDIKWVMWDRRGADKVSPVQRWMVARTAHVRREDRRSKAYAVLPDNTIGRHAASHVKDLPEFTVRNDDAFSYGSWWFRREENRFRDACRYVAVVEALREVAHTRLHLRLNEIVGAPIKVDDEPVVKFAKGEWVIVEESRFIDGQRLIDADDVEDFLLRCKIHRRGYGYDSALLDKVEKFLKEHGFDIL